MEVIDPTDGLPTRPISAHTSPRSRWQTFAKVSAYHTGHIEGTPQRVDEQWLIEHMPDLDSPWQAGHGVGDQEKGTGTLFSSHAKRRAWYVRLEVSSPLRRPHDSPPEQPILKSSQRALLRNPLVPLAFRLTMWSFSLIALALGASIYSLSHDRHISQRPSTFIAIIFDSVALVYLFYITYDEYSSKPLGLRPPKAKMRLILLDLFFIVFNSANLSLAFDALTDPRGPCKDGPAPNSSGRNETSGLNDGHKDNDICARQSALSGVLLIALFAWLLTFAVSVFRYDKSSTSIETIMFTDRSVKVG